MCYDSCQIYIIFQYTINHFKRHNFAIITWLAICALLAQTWLCTSLCKQRKVGTLFSLGFLTQIFRKNTNFCNDCELQFPCKWDSLNCNCPCWIYSYTGLYKIWFYQVGKSLYQENLYDMSMQRAHCVLHRCFGNMARPRGKRRRWMFSPLSSSCVSCPHNSEATLWRRHLVLNKIQDVFDCVMRHIM